MPWGARQCPRCNFNGFDQDYWRNRAQEDGRQEEPLFLGERSNHISAPLDADLEDIYSDDKCFECEHFMTSNCQPYMDWRIEYDFSRPGFPIPSPIPESCENFLQDPILLEEV